MKRGQILMYSPKVNISADMTDEEPTSILRVFGDFKSRVRSSTGAHSNVQMRNISSSSMGGYGITSANQRLRFVRMTLICLQLHRIIYV